MSTTKKDPASTLAAEAVRKTPGFATLCIHAGQDPEPVTGAVAVPIFQTSTYIQEAFGKPRQGYEYARQTGLSLIAVMKDELGDLDRVKRIVKVLGMVNATPEFGEQPEVINGCSDLFVTVFGDRGRHARSAVGMGSLPSGIPVEIECIVEIGPAARAARKPVRKKSKKK